MGRSVSTGHVLICWAKLARHHRNFAQQVFRVDILNHPHRSGVIPVAVQTMLPHAPQRVLSYFAISAGYPNASQWLRCTYQITMEVARVVN